MSATDGRRGRILWGGVFNDSDCIFSKIKADGEFHTYSYPITEATRLDKIRLVPVDVPGAVRIKSITVPFVPGPGAVVESVHWDRSLQRAGRPERLVAVLENMSDSAGKATVKLTLPAGLRAVGKGEQIVELKQDERRSVVFQVQAEKPVSSGRVVVNAGDGNGHMEARELRVDFLDPTTVGSQSYVPEPNLAPTKYLVGAMYSPRPRKEGNGLGWRHIEAFPERKPALGWYDEGNPEATDWEINWCLASGISFFVYPWLREGVDEEVKVRMPYAIHDGLLKARYASRFKFAIMWDNRNGSGVASMDDLLQTLFPYWMKNYFRHKSYLKINNRPVLFIHDIEKLIDELGGPRLTAGAFAAFWSEARKSGFSDMVLLGEERASDLKRLRQFADVGCDGSFACSWPNIPNDAPPDRATSLQMSNMEHRVRLNFLPDVPLLSMGWDRRPLMSVSESTRGRGFFRVPPTHFKTLCRRVKRFMDALPKDHIGHRMLLLDNWNGWGEGRYIAPCRQNGFGYLEAIREVFTTASGPAGYVLPEEVGRGPYDGLYRAAKKAEKEGKKAEDGEQPALRSPQGEGGKTEGRRQRTDDRRQKTEDSQPSVVKEGGKKIEDKAAEKKK